MTANFDYYRNPERVVIGGSKFQYPSTMSLSDTIRRRYFEGTTIGELMLLFGKSRGEIFNELGKTSKVRTA